MCDALWFYLSVHPVVYYVFHSWCTCDIVWCTCDIVWCTCDIVLFCVLPHNLARTDIFLYLNPRLTYPHVWVAGSNSYMGDLVLSYLFSFMVGFFGAGLELLANKQ